MSSPIKESTPTPQEPKQARPRWQPRPPPTQEERYHDEIRNLIYAFAILLKCTAFYVVCQGIRAIIDPANRVALARIAAKGAVGR